MKYLLMICSEEAGYEKFSEEDMGKLMADYGVYTEALQEAGNLVGAERLKPTTTATTVRVRNGEASTIDGPFAETKEQMGGYYLVDVKDLDEAIAWAGKCPTAKYGSIEIRPVWEM